MSADPESRAVLTPPTRQEPDASRPCRHCGAHLSHLFVDLRMSPVSNALREPEAWNTSEVTYPLRAWICSECLLVQLEVFESPEAIFDDDYAYFSSYSDSLLEHSERYVEAMSERFRLGPGKTVVELASNDGYLLQYFLPKGVRVLGVEPSGNVAAAAMDKGIETIVEFFGVDLARRMRAEGTRADLITANNVLAHVPDLNDFVSGMKILLAEGGVVTAEFPHLMRLIEGNQFDTIYHEHFCYFSFHTVQRVFSAHGLTLFDVEELPTHGGSLRIFGRHADETTEPVTDRVSGLLDVERSRGLDRLESYLGFNEQVEATKRDLLRFLIDAKENGKTVAGYGAPAKASTLLNYCGVGTDLVAYTVDRSHRKQGRYIPGVHVPIHAPEMLMETKPDYVLIFAWNLKDEIMSSMSEVSGWGGRFVVPIPRLQIL